MACLASVILALGSKMWEGFARVLRTQRKKPVCGWRKAGDHPLACSALLTESTWTPSVQASPMATRGGRQSRGPRGPGDMTQMEGKRLGRSTHSRARSSGFKS